MIAVDVARHGERAVRSEPVPVSQQGQRVGPQPAQAPGPPLRHLGACNGDVVEVRGELVQGQGAEVGHRLLQLRQGRGGRQPRRLPQVRVGLDQDEVPVGRADRGQRRLVGAREGAGLVVLLQAEGVHVLQQCAARGL